MRTGWAKVNVVMGTLWHWPAEPLVQAKKRLNRGVRGPITMSHQGLYAERGGNCSKTMVDPRERLFHAEFELSAATSWLLGEFLHHLLVGWIIADEIQVSVT